MRIKSSQSLKALSANGVIGETAAKQIKKALAEIKREPKKPCNTFLNSAVNAGDTQSPGEAHLRQCLSMEFGWWDDGGDLVQELMPLPDRKFRVDFALPRWRCYIEVDGWQHHGQFLAAHHSDRERGLALSAAGWIPFRVSHDQALNQVPLLVGSLRQLMSTSSPCPRDALVITAHQGPVRSWSQLRESPTR